MYVYMGRIQRYHVLLSREGQIISWGGWLDGWSCVTSHCDQLKSFQNTTNVIFYVSSNLVGQSSTNVLWGVNSS